MTQNKMIKIGLTGGIGSGKSTVSAAFKEKGINIIDADIIAREVLDIYSEISLQIKEKFGERFFDENNILKRRELGNFIFSDKSRTDELNSIMIPFIKQEIMKRFDEYARAGEKICVLDAPTLIEHGMNKMMDIIILVWVDKKTEINRVLHRDNLTEKQIINRINSQMMLDDKIKYADYVIDNSKDLEKTQMQIDNIYKYLERINIGNEEI